MIELLSPAGDFEKLKFAFLYGADAVYIGGEYYSLRANANNFSLEEIKAAVEYAHNLNKKVYVTVNIVLHNEELDNLKTFNDEWTTYTFKNITISGIELSPINKASLYSSLSLDKDRGDDDYDNMLQTFDSIYVELLIGAEIIKVEDYCYVNFFNDSKFKEELDALKN